MARMTRAEREALVAQKQAQLAKDQRNQTLIGVAVIVAVVLVVALIAFFIVRSNQASKPSADSVKEAKAAISKVKEKPANANADNGFTISKNGVNKPVSGVPTVSNYMDFICPACAAFEQSAGNDIAKMVQAGQINLDIHPEAFLDRSSTDEYSTRSASAIVYVAEHDPANLLTAIQAMFDPAYQPQEASSYKPTSDKMIAAQLKKAGVKASVADASVKGTYKKWVKAVSSYDPLQEKLWHQHGDFKGQMTTPTLLVNGHYVDLVLAPSQLSNTQIVTKSIGLDTAEIGNSSVLPSVKTGKPIDLE